jgi:trigger factor
VRPVAQPEYEFELPQTDDDDWEFTATVRVQEKPELADWSALEVGAFEPDVPEELVERELDALRATVAELVPVEGRPVGAEDTVIVDLVSPSGEERRDYVVELGRGSVVDEIEAGVVGMQAGETKEISFELGPEGAENQSVTLTVKEIKEKKLPEIDDELARSASEFETLAELRGDIESRLGEQISEEVEALVREQADLLEEDADASLDRLRESGRFETLREDMRLRKALDRIVSEVKRIPRELAEAREAIWTPDKEKPQTETKLWTPGS